MPNLETIFLGYSLVTSTAETHPPTELAGVGNFSSWAPILDMRHIQYQGETLPPDILAFHLVLGKFHIYMCPTQFKPLRSNYGGITP